MELHQYRNSKNRTIIEELTFSVNTSEPDDPYRAVYIMYLDLLADLVPSLIQRRYLLERA